MPSKSITNTIRDEAIGIAKACIKDVPVMVIGSGASAAHGIRGMVALANHLIAEVKPSDSDAPLWNNIKSALQKNLGLEAALKNEHITDALSHQITHFTREMIQQDERRLYSELLDRNEQLPLSYLFQYLFRTTHKVLNVVTTNYDRLAEFATWQAKHRCNTGFTDGGLKHFHGQHSNERHYTEQAKFRCVDVWKVHGSVDWFQCDSRGTTSIMDGIEVPKSFKPLLVTPGDAKYSRTHQEPYRSVIACADRAMEAARGFLCVGYGFSDDHIEPKLIHRTAAEKVPMVIAAQELKPGAKSFLEKHWHSNLIAFEQDGDDTRVYMNKHRSGIILHNEQLWSFKALLQTLGIS